MPPLEVPSSAKGMVKDVERFTEYGILNGDIHRWKFQIIGLGVIVMIIHVAIHGHVFIQPP